MKDSQENIILNIDVNKPGNKIKSEIKQRKRKHSLPLKSFKVSSPAESQSLSIICDNIFEDVNMAQNNNLSKSIRGLRSNIFLSNIIEEAKKKEENINIINLEDENENKIIINSKTFNAKNNNNGEIEDNDFNRVQLVHKKSYIFNNILKLKLLKCPRLLEEQWIYEKILLDYNIIDFTSKKIYINIYYNYYYS